MNDHSTQPASLAIYRRPLSSLATAVTCLFCLLHAEPPSTPALHPFGINDLLKLSSVGKAQAMGKQIVWEQAPPYEQIGYYGLGHVGSWWEAGYQLRTSASAGGQVVSRPLFTPEPDTSYWLGSVSPDSRCIAFYAAKQGSFFAGVFDAQEERVVRFDAIPSLVRDWETAWPTSEKLIFSGTADGRQPLSAARPYTGFRRNEAWARSWSGGVAVDVTDSAAPEPGSQWLPGRLYQANVRTGALEVLAEGTYASLAVSADGRYLAALHEGPAGSTPQGDWVWSRTQLVLFDLHHGGATTVIVPEKEVMKGSLTWAPDSNRLAFFAWSSGESVRTGMFQSWDTTTETLQSHSHTGLDLASQRERGWMQLPEQPVWLDGRLVVCARPHEGKEARFAYRDITQPGTPGYPGKADWFLLNAETPPQNLTASFKEVSASPVHADATSLTVLADGGVWRLSAKAAPVNLTPGFSAPLTWPRSTIASRFMQRGRFPATAVFEVRESDQPVFALLDIIAGKVARIPFTKATDTVMAVSVEGGAVLFRSNNPVSSDLVVKTTDGHETVVTQLNSHLASVAKTAWRSISYPVQTPKGERTVRGRLLLPPDYQPGRRYPAIIEVYPGRSNLGSDTDYESSHGLNSGPASLSVHLFAAKGYVVFYPNTATDYIRTDHGPINGMTGMVEQGIDALVQQGYADPARLGLLGVSQGGFSSLWVASESARFKAVVSLNGWADMYSHYSESFYLSDFVMKDFRGSAVRYENKTGGDFNIGRSPYDAPEAYVKNSPLFRAGQVAAPTMLIHSDMDTFAMSHYERFFTALTLRNKRAQLVRYWGEGHSPSSPGNIRDMNSRMFAWFDDYCDVARDAQGTLLWDGDHVQSRKGAPALKPEEFLEFEHTLEK